MKRIFFLLMMTMTWKVDLAQYKPTDPGSSVRFTIQNFGFDVNGTFKGLYGTIDFDRQNPQNAHFNVELDAASINTDNSLRDEHLRGESYFDVKRYSKIRLESTRVTAGNKPGIFILTGKLTIKNTTQIISFPFTATPTASGYDFNGTFKINRKDFGVGGTSTISNDLQVSLNIMAKK